MSDRTQDLKNLRAVATACKNYVDETKEQILWQVGQYDITTQDDNTTAYQKVVPAGATRAKIKSIGGMSYKSENLIVLNDVAETTINGITYSISNGVIKLNGTASANTKFSFEFVNPILKNKDYYAVLFISGTTTATNPKALGETNTDARILITTTKAFNVNYDVNYFWFSAGNGTVWTNYVIKLMIIEGTTAPTDYKQGFTGIRDSAITSIKSYDSNNNLIDTYTIPSEIQALEGYGRGINENCYNVLNLDTKEFTDKDDKKDLGTLSYSKIENGALWLFQTTLSSKKTSSKLGLCPIYDMDYIHASAWDIADKTIDISGTSANAFIKDETYTTAQAFKTAMSGVPLQYELATYNTTDNLELPNNVIEVEAGGYLVFENQYRQAVPSNITYRIEVAN